MQAENSDAAQAETMLLSVIVPARNEEASLRACLESLAAQGEEDFQLGRDWELIVVDDASTDATAGIARGVAGAIVMAAPPLVTGWTGKANACWTAAQQARGKWLLFTDADTVHEPGDLRRALHEAEKYHAGMLSYSPRQIVGGFWQRALMPLIFSDLAQKYPPRLVSDLDSPVAAANGQFLLVAAGVYRCIGGHKAVRGAILEDVELARLVKKAGIGLRFRYAPDALATRMYRSFAAMCEGWRKNLALLFPDALSRGIMKWLQSALIFGLPLLAIWMYLTVMRTALIWLVGLWWIWRLGVHFSRVSKAHFPAMDTALSLLGLPLYGSLLLDSWMRKTMRRPVEWKGRSYLG